MQYGPWDRNNARGKLIIHCLESGSLKVSRQVGCSKETDPINPCLCSILNASIVRDKLCHVDFTSTYSRVLYCLEFLCLVLSLLLFLCCFIVFYSALFPILTIFCSALSSVYTSPLPHPVVKVGSRGINSTSQKLGNANRVIKI